jgi:acyl carrier protein
VYDAEPKQDAQSETGRSAGSVLLVAELPGIVPQEEKMTKQEFLREVEALIEVAPGTLKGDDVLASYPEWDSMRVLGFIVLVEEQLHQVVDGAAVAKATTVNELLGLVAAHLQG